MKQSNFRNEWKHEISPGEKLALRARLSAVAYPDAHSINGQYKIRSLYFDDLRDTALQEKITGVNRREKFRIRYYNGDLSFIQLEKKEKINGLCRKQSVSLTLEQTQAILDGRCEWMLDKGGLLEEFYSKLTVKGLRPKVIVDYTREAFTRPEGNVRVTLDSDIRSGLSCTDFLNPSSPTVPVGNMTILEVKWDAYLPDIIRDAVQAPGLRSAAFSKYAACRFIG